MNVFLLQFADHSRCDAGDELASTRMEPAVAETQRMGRFGKCRCCYSQSSEKLECLASAFENFENIFAPLLKVIKLLKIELWKANFREFKIVVPGAGWDSNPHPLAHQACVLPLRVCIKILFV